MLVDGLGCAAAAGDGAVAGGFIVEWRGYGRQMSRGVFTAPWVGCLARGACK